MINKNLLMGKIISVGLTQKAAAKKIGMSKNTLNSKINNRIDMHSNEILDLCKLLGITKDEEKVQIFLHEPSQNRGEN